MKVTVFLFVCALLVIQSTALISINFDPDDLDQIIDFVQTININEQPRPIQLRKCNMVKLLKKTLFNMIQMTGIMFTLVGANLISLQFTPIHHPNQTYESEKINPTNVTNICSIDFGCNNNQCWKTCDKIINGQKTWCYNSPTPREIKYCTSAKQCNICWDCVETCHA